MMAMYKTCSVCNAHLDPGEMCDCEREQAKCVTGDVFEAPRNQDAKHKQEETERRTY